MPKQLVLIKLECPVFGRSHHWMIDSFNQGVCKCGAIKDFVPENKRAFPEDYAKALRLGINMNDIMKSKVGYCLQGSLPEKKYRIQDYKFTVDYNPCL